MKRYSATSKKAQQWIKEASKDNLFLCSIYDELGHFKQSESIYESTIKIARFIRVSEDNLDTLENEDEEDVDVLVVDDVNTGRYDYGDVSKISDYGNVDIADETNASKQHINEFIRALSMGGSNVRKSLEQLSLSVSRWSNPNLFKSSILLALSYYYKNPLIAADVSVFVGNQKLLADDIISGDVDQDTVALLAEFHNKGIEKRNNFISVYQQVNELLKTHRPDLADNDHIIKFILSNYNDFGSELTPYQIKYIIKDTHSLDVNAVDKAFMYAETAKSKNLPRSSSVSYSLLRSMIFFFSKYPQETVFKRVIALLDTNRDVFEFTLGNSSYNYIESLLFGRENAISQVEMKLYPGIVEGFLQSPLPPYNSGMGHFDQRRIASQYINPLLIAKAPMNKYGTDRQTLGSEYFVDKSEAFNYMSTAYPDVKNNLWLAAGYQMIQMDEVNGKKAFDMMTQIWQSNQNLVLDFFAPALMPVYIKYFSNYNKDFTMNSLFSPFNICYLYIGEKIYDYSLAEINRIAGSFDLAYGLPGDGKLTIEQYEVVKQHSGKFLDGRHTGLSNFKYAQYIIDFYFSHQFAYQIPAETLDNFYEFVKSNYSEDFNMAGCAKNLFILGRFDKDLFKDVADLYLDSVNVQNIDHIAKLITEKNKSEVPFIGSYDSLKNLGNVSAKYPDLTNTELYACLGNPEQAYKIREAISKSKNYSQIVPHSEEYNKLFILFAQNYNIRGRDPAMLINLVDSVINVNTPNRTFQHFHYLSAAIGTFDFSNVSSRASEVLTTVNFKSETNDMFIGDMFIRESGMKAEHIINIGGFDVLFEMTEEEVKEWLERLRFRNPDKFLNNWVAYRPYINKFNSLALKLDRNILYNKILFAFYKNFFDGIKSLKPDILDDMGPGSSFEQIVLGNVFRNSIHEHKNYIRTYLSGGSECDEELLKIYKLDVRLPKKVMLPKEDLRTMMTTFGDKESLSNIGKIVQIFGNITPQILDAYSFDLCRKNGYPTKGFDSIPDLQLKENIIHDFANLLPTNLNQKFNGYPQYFLTNFPDDKKGDLRLVGDAWNSRISLWDDNDNVLEEGLVYEFSSKYNVSDLSQIIKHNSFRQVMKDLPVESKPFAYQFCDIRGLPTEADNKSGRYKKLFAGTQKVFLDGLKVKLPDWASFTGKSGELTLRFLRRDEPQGMFLGRLSKCCQEPENWAASCAYDGHLNPNAAFAVFEGPEGLVFQSYVWADKDGNVCFDSIESPLYDFRFKYKREGQELMENFADSLPSGKICTVGNNSFGFKSADTKLRNPTETNNIPYVSQLLYDFCPSNTSSLYRADSLSQYDVGVGKKESS